MCVQKGESLKRRRLSRWSCLLVLGPVLVAISAVARAEQTPSEPDTSQGSSQPRTETTEDYNKRLEELSRTLVAPEEISPAQDYRVGADDLLEISVFEAPDLNRTVRVSARGEISLPLFGTLQAAGLTVRELEAVLEELLRRTYMKDPHVAVFLKEMQSHPVSVLGAVNKPGVFQIRGAKTLVEVLSMTDGLAEDAGNTVIVIRHPGFEVSSATESFKPIAATGLGKSDDPSSATIVSANEKTRKALDVDLKNLLESGDPRSNVLVYP